MSGTRQRLPDRRGSVRFSFMHDNSIYSATLSKFADGRLAEIFIDAQKPDSQLALHANDAAVLASLFLQHGITAAAIRHSIAGPSLARSRTPGGLPATFPL